MFDYAQPFDYPEAKLPKNIVGRTFFIVRKVPGGHRTLEKVTAIKEYPHFVLCTDNNGFRECFSRWELARAL